MDRRAIAVSGIVQGVGFRPFVYGLASDLHSSGFVRELRRRRADRGRGRASQSRPIPGRARHQAPAAGPHRSTCGGSVQPPRGDPTFRIEPSERDADSGSIFISPDVATCDDCLAELFDPRDRRYRYPFLNCTNCGPRLTIITGAPYDRERTTMAALRHVRPLPGGVRRSRATVASTPSRPPARAAAPSLSSSMARDGRSPPTIRSRSRPGLCWLDRSWLSRAWAAIISPARRATSGPWRSCAVGSTAMRSRSPSWCRDLAAAERTLRDRPGRGATAHLAAPPDRAACVESPARRVAEAVAPGNPFLGVMLPYTPLHHLLLRELDGTPLVMTSGNRSDEPIAYDDRRRPRDAWRASPTFSSRTIGRSTSAATTR